MTDGQTHRWMDRWTDGRATAYSEQFTFAKAHLWPTMNIIRHVAVFCDSDAVIQVLRFTYLVTENRDCSCNETPCRIQLFVCTALTGPPGHNSNRGDKIQELHFDVAYCLKFGRYFKTWLCSH